jgi:hypothetical protein
MNIKPVTASFNFADQSTNPFNKQTASPETKDQAAGSVRFRVSTPSLDEQGLTYSKPIKVSNTSSEAVLPTLTPTGTVSGAGTVKGQSDELPPKAVTFTGTTTGPINITGVKDEVAPTPVVFNGTVSGPIQITGEKDELEVTPTSFTGTASEARALPNNLKDIEL